MHHRTPALDLDIRSHTHQFQRVHEAVLKNILRHHRGAFRLRGQCHKLRLHVCGEARILLGRHVARLQRRVAHHPHGVSRNFRPHAGLFQFPQQRVKMTGIAVRNFQVASCHRSCNDERPGFDAVGDDAMLGPAQLADAFHANGRRARALNLRPHLVQQRGQVADFRFLRAIPHHGFTFGERRGHQQVFGAGDGNFVEDNLRTCQPRCRCFYITVFLRNGRAQPLQALEMQINRSRADGASSRHGHARVPASCHQRPQHQRRGAHGFHQFVARLGAGNVLAMNTGAVLGASIPKFDLGAHRRQQLARGLNVAHLRNVFQNHRLIGKQRGRHAGKRGILRAADAYRPQQRLSAAYDQFVHIIDEK